MFRFLILCKTDKCITKYTVQTRFNYVQFLLIEFN